MKVLIITVAGKASRFNNDLNDKTLKCLFSFGNIQHSLLYKIVEKSDDIDRIIVVGGFMFDKLKLLLKEKFGKYRDKINLVYNKMYDEYGSSYSLYLGIKEAQKYNPKEIIFVEGDLFYNVSDFNKIVSSTKDVITINNELIIADKSVILYVDINDNFFYVYDRTHKCLQIERPFKCVYNSGQIWKFIDVNRLFIINKLSISEKHDSALLIIQKYFNEVKINEVDVINIKTWHNCNTLKDYEVVYKIMLEEGMKG